MITIGSTELRLKLRATLEKAANGETIVVTLKGLPVARIVPPIQEDFPGPPTDPD